MNAKILASLALLVILVSICAVNFGIVPITAATNECGHDACCEDACDECESGECDPCAECDATSAAGGETSCEEHIGSVGETTWVPMPGGTLVKIEVLDIEDSPFGAYDFLVYGVWSETEMTMLGITDNADAKALIDAMFEEMPGMAWSSVVVDDTDLEVWLDCGKLLGHLYAESPVGPLDLEFKAFGESESETESFITGEYEMTASFEEGYAAFVNIVTWEYQAIGVLALQMRMTITELAS